MKIVSSENGVDIVELIEADLKANRFCWLRKPDKMYGQGYKDNFKDDDYLLFIQTESDNDMEFGLVPKKESSTAFNWVADEIRRVGFDYDTGSYVGLYYLDNDQYDLLVTIDGGFRHLCGGIFNDGASLNQKNYHCISKCHCDNFKTLKDEYPNDPIIEYLKDVLYGVTKTKEDPSNYASLIGKVFVTTGDVTTFSNRSELKDLIQKLGGSMATVISNKTDYLINNDLESKSSKNKSAKLLGVPIISENDFNKMIGRN